MVSDPLSWNIETNAFCLHSGAPGWKPRYAMSSQCELGVKAQACYTFLRWTWRDDPDLSYEYGVKTHTSYGLTVWTWSEDPDKLAMPSQLEPGVKTQICFVLTIWTWSGCLIVTNTCDTNRLHFCVKKPLSHFTHIISMSSRKLRHREDK